MHTLSPGPVAYDSTVSASPASERSESGYASRRSSVQDAAGDMYHWAPKRIPDTPESVPSPKRARTDLFGELDHRSWSSTNPISNCKSHA